MKYYIEGEIIMAKRVIMKRNMHDYKQRLFIYILSFIVMSFIMSMIVWGTSSTDEPQVQPVYEYIVE